MNQIKPRHKAIGWILFISYLLLLLYFLFFAESMGRNNHSGVYSYNIEPFREIIRFYKHRQIVGFGAFVLNIFGNIFAFIPFGFFRPIIGIHRHSFFKTLFQGALFSAVVEIIQVLSTVGSFDIDDIILNSIGVLIGYIIFILSKNALKNRK